MSVTKLDSNQAIKKALSYNTLVSGAKGSITTTAAQITATATDLAVGVWIKALTTNTNTVYVGSSNAVTNSNGYPLAAGDEVFVQVDDLSKIWLYGGAAGQEIRYIGS